MIREWSARLHIRRIREHYPASKHHSVLEVGCNRGLLLEEIRRLCGSVFGNDIDEAVVAHAGQLGNRGNVHLRVIKPRKLTEIATGDGLGLASVHSSMYFVLTPNFISVFRKQPN